MKYEDLKTLVCPICGMRYTGRPAVSRKDNATNICSDCATRESLDSIGVVGKEQDAIIETIHRYYQEYSCNCTKERALDLCTNGIDKSSERR